jgi:hypothetical protein
MIQWEILIPVALASAVSAWRIIKYFTKKEICFGILKNKVNQLDELASKSSDTHGDIYEEIGELRTNHATLESKLDLLLEHFNLSKKTDKTV